MKISREDVVRVAELAHLELAADEAEKYREQLDSIIEYIGKLNELDTANVEPMTQVFSPQTSEVEDPTLREDVVIGCDVAAEVLKQAPDAAAPYFRVPKVIERG